MAHQQAVLVAKGDWVAIKNPPLMLHDSYRHPRGFP
jgi:hypothetical protein